MHPYAIGLDIGITSVGWAVVALDADEQPCGIINMGSRIFDAAEQPKTGESLAAPRREARSARRRLRRHRHRAERIRRLIVNSGMLTGEELDSLFDGRLEDIYALRVRALDEKLRNDELARVLIHISQRRGFKSNRRGDSGKEDGKILEAVKANAERMERAGYRTVAEMLLNDEKFSAHKRNIGGEYIATVTRAMTEDEVHKIFAAQRGFGQEYASEDIENAYLAILLSQRSFDEGPGGNSPYGGSQIERMIGKSNGEQRAAKATYSFEYFNLLQKVNHIRLVSPTGDTELTEEQRKIIIDAAHKKEPLTFANIRTMLGVPEGTNFNMVYYANDKSNEECEKKEKFCYLKAYHQMRKAFESVRKGSFEKVSRAQLNAIGTVLSIYKNADTVERELIAAGIEPEFIEALLKLNFSGFGHISVYACDLIIPQLEKGLKYNEACDAAGINFRAHDKAEKDKYLHPTEKDFEDITSPVVRRAVSQTIKVVNAIIRKQETSPVFINIELAREMSKSLAERNDIKKKNDKNAAENESLKQYLREECNIAYPTGQDIVKLRLWREQDGKCAYSLKAIPIERLFDDKYTEIDHIVPYSISFDDTRKNKVLVLTAENQRKGKRLPLQYMQGEQREKFIVWVNQNVNDRRKKENLLRETYSEEGFKERNLQDTKYIAVFMQNYLRDKLLFAPSDKRNKRVTAVNGAVTAYMRKGWGITKIREDGDLHHAIDALVIACTTQGMIQRVSKYYNWRECRYMESDEGAVVIDPYTGEVIDKFPYPWPIFRKELEAILCDDPSRAIADLKLKFYMDDDAPTVRPLFVSRMPKRKVTGAAHEATVKSARAIDRGCAVIKKKLTGIELDANGEIKNYYKEARNSDPLLYNALKAQLTLYGGNAAKAFAEPFHKPKSDGTQGPVVKTVKLEEKTTLNVPVRDGIAKNDSMVRIDVFKVEGDGYYFVPIYITDTLKPELPNKACVAKKLYSNWKVMDEKDFVFSLYKNDLIKVTDKKPMVFSNNQKNSTLPATMETTSAMVYFDGADIGEGRIQFITHDDTYIKRSGIKTLANIEKYTVDVLGEYHPVGKEKRNKFNIKRG